jgi:hypothetical protein
MRVTGKEGGLADLYVTLPRLAVDADGQLDYQACDASELSVVVARAEAAARSVQLGIAAIGLLIAHTAQSFNGNVLSPQVYEALGELVNDLAELAVQCTGFARDGRAHLWDYTPPGS